MTAFHFDNPSIHVGQVALRLRVAPDLPLTVAFNVFCYIKSECNLNVKKKIVAQRIDWFFVYLKSHA